MRVLRLLGLVALSDVLRADEDAFGEDEMEDGYDGGGYGGGMEDMMGGMGGDPYGGGYGDDEYGGGYGEGGGGDMTPAFETLDDADSVKKFISADPSEPSVVGFFEEERDADEIAKFEALANSNRYDFRFAYSVEDDVRAAYKFTKGPAVLVYGPERFYSEKYDKKRSRYPSKSIDVDALRKFAYKTALPLVGQKTWKSNDRYDKTELPILTLFATVDLEKNPKGFDYFANRLRKVAVDYVGKVVFNVGDKEDFSYTLTDYDIELPEKKDAAAVGIKDGLSHYKMDSKFNVENLKAFVESFLAGELTPKIKEENAYEDASGGDEGDYGDVSYASTDVVQLTDDNFAAETAGKDAFLEFYAPWCGHCKTLKPAYSALATRLKGSAASVVVGAMDATENEPPAEFEVQGYPTIFFKPNGGEVESYEGGRDADSMYDFILANAANKITDEL